MSAVLWSPFAIGIAPIMEEYASHAPPACAVHPEEPARLICARCGGYMCALCDESGRYQICEPCRRLTGEGYFPLDRENFTVGKSLEFAWSRFKTQWPLLCVAAIIVFGASFALSLARQVVMIPLSHVMEGNSAGAPAVVLLVLLFAGSLFIEGAVTWTLNVGLVRVCLDVLHGHPASIGRMFSQFRKIGKVVLQGLAAGVAIGIPAALWVALIAGAATLGSDGRQAFAYGTIAFLIGLVPFTYYALPFFFMQTELALGENTGPVESIVNAALVVRGKRWPVLGALALMPLFSMVGMLFCFVGIVPAWALAQLVIAAVYLALRNGSEVTSPTEFWRG